MTIVRNPLRARGVALLVVMLMVFAMAVIVGAFAYTMRIEGRLAMRTQSEGDLEWMGRSGVEMAKWVLSLSRQIPGEQGYDGLNQFWAGGPGPTNLLENVFEGVSLIDVPLGDGTISIQIIDTDRKLNINTVAQRSPKLLELILQICGAVGTDPADSVTAIRDWIDPDDQSGPGASAESDFYLGLDPPYVAKNGPIDDISELLKIRGITPELYWGPRGRGVGSGSALGTSQFGKVTDLGQSVAGTVGLADVFCAISAGQVNINTAPFSVLVLACGGNENMARNIIEQRSGLDQQEGTWDDTPARSTGEIARLQGAPLAPDQASPMATFSVSSSTFEIQVEATLGPLRRRFTAVVRRVGSRDMPILTFRRD